MPTEQEILKALSTIIDPDFQKDIVSLGFIKNIQSDNGHISLDIALTTPACPVKDEFRRQAEHNLRQLQGVKSVGVNMTTLPRKPRPEPQASNALTNVRSIIAVSSCKGGVGKSTVAAHIAQDLAQRGYKVGLVDCDIYGPSVPSLFNLNRPPVYQNEQGLLVPVEKNRLKIMSFGFLLGDAPAVLRGPIASRYIQQILTATAWGELDYLFIDMPPGTGDIQLTITQAVQLSGALIITTPQTLSLIDVARGILMFEKVNVPILGLIENMAFFTCDECSKKHFLFGGGVKSLEKRFGINVLAQLPILPQLTMNLDTPITNTYISEAADHLIRAIGKETLNQKRAPHIQFNEKEITLSWEPEQILTVSNRDLRSSCQCALCIDEISGKKLLDKGTIRSDIAAKEVFALGNYALAITWNDGHSSGIYPYETIRAIGKITKGKVPIP